MKLPTWDFSRELFTCETSHLHVFFMWTFHVFCSEVLINTCLKNTFFHVVTKTLSQALMVVRLLIITHTCHHRYEPHETNLDSITCLITFPIYITPFGSFPRRYCFCSIVSCLYVTHVSWFVSLCYLLLKSLSELAFWLPAYTLQNNASPKGSIF